MVYSGCRFSCSHSRQADGDLAKKRTLPFWSLTSHCCAPLLNSILLARWISSRPSSCNGRASVQRHRAVPSMWEDIVVFTLSNWFVDGVV